MWMIFFEVVADALQIRSGGRSPADSHFLGAQHLLKPRVHFFLLDKVSSVSLRYPLPHSGTKMGIFVKQPQRCFFHQPFGVLAFPTG